jgi:hypothetical protein
MNGPMSTPDEEEVLSVPVVHTLEGRDLGTTGRALPGPEVEHDGPAGAEQPGEVELARGRADPRPTCWLASVPLVVAPGGP